VAFRDEVLADAPVSYWRLGETAGATTAVDEKGLNPGTYSGPTTTAGLLSEDANAARDFDGVDDRVEVPSAASLNLTGAFTLEALVRPDVLGANQRAIIRKAPGNPSPYGLDTTNGAFRVLRHSGGFQILSAGVASVGKRAHVVGTYDGTNLRLYVDGALVGTLAAAGVGAVSTAPLYIGHTTDPFWFDGAIDEVAVYNVALSAARVGVHWRASNPVLSARSGFGVQSPRAALTLLSLPALSARSGFGLGSPRSSPILRMPLRVRSGFGVGSQADLEFFREVALPGHEAPMRWEGALWLNRNLDANSEPVLPRYETARIAGRGDTAELESRREARTGARGEVFRRTLRRGKGETYEGAIIAGSLGELQRAVTELRAAFDDPSEGRMEILPHSKQGLFYDYFFRAGEASLTVPDEQAVPPSHSSLGWTRPFVLTLRLPDALYLEAHRRKRIAETIIGGRTTVLCENRGTTAAEPTLMVYGPVTAPWVVYNATAATQLRFLTAIPSGSAVEIDFAKRSILLAGVAQRFNRATSNWFDAGVPGLAPGVNEVGLEAPGLVAPARLEVFFHHTLA
jgi:hypothetical protein